MEAKYDEQGVKCLDILWVFFFTEIARSMMTISYFFRNSQEYYANCTVIVKNKKSGVSIAVNVRKFCDVS